MVLTKWPLVQKVTTSYLVLSEVWRRRIEDVSGLPWRLGSVGYAILGSQCMLGHPRVG
jgi:hypothetical protein